MPFSSGIDANHFGRSRRITVSVRIAALIVGSRSGAHHGECNPGSGTPDVCEASSFAAVLTALIAFVVFGP
jgi:hypothetical protein